MMANNNEQTMSKMELFGIEELLHGQTSGQSVENVMKRFTQKVEVCAEPEVAKMVLSEMFNEDEMQRDFGCARSANAAPEPLTGNSSGATISKFTADLARYNRVKNALTAFFRNRMLALCDPDEVDLLKIEGDARRVTAYTLRELMKRIREVFGPFGDAELDAIRKSLGDPMVDTMQLTKHMMKLDTKIRLLTENKRLVDESNKKTALIQSVGGYGGTYSDALRVYTGTALEEQTYAKLKTALAAEHLRLIRTSSTALHAGFAAPIISVANAAAGAVVGGGGGGGAGGGGGRGPQQQIQGAGRGRGGAQGGRGGRGRGGERQVHNAAGVIVGLLPDTHYCWLVARPEWRATCAPFSGVP